MAWVKVDDGFADHPKTLVLSLAAQGLWLAGLCYASRHMTDGRLPAAFLRRLGDETAYAAAEELVAVGLWHDNGAGWDIHDYTDYQRTREQITALSEVRAAAGQRGGEAKAKQAAGKLLANGQQPESKRLPDTDTDTERDTETENVGSARTRAATHPAAASKRKPSQTKFRRGFQPSEATLAWARGAGWQDEAFEQEFEKFADYFVAKGTRYADWDQALVNWLKKAAEFNQAKVVPIRANGAKGRSQYDDFVAGLDQFLTGDNG